MSDDDFSWTNEAINIPVQGPIAVYANAFGDLVICEQGQDGDDDDVVLVRKANVPALLVAIKNAMKGAK